MFLGSKFCPHCGAKAAGWEQTGEAALPCPGCATPMLHARVGRVDLHECPRCFGVWLDQSNFEEVCANAEQQSLVLGAVAEQPELPLIEEPRIRYMKCARCAELMFRKNFGRCSGVVVDVCRGHGTWFELNELRRVVEFVRTGGLERARGREIEQQKAEKARLDSALSGGRGMLGPDYPGGPTPEADDLLSTVVFAAGESFFEWMRER